MAICDIAKTDRPYRYGQNMETMDEEEMGEKDMEIVSLKAAKRFAKKEVVRGKSDERNPRRNFA